MQAYRHGYPTLDPQDCWRANAWPLKVTQHGEHRTQEPTRISAKTSAAFDVCSDITSGNTQIRSSLTENRALTLLNDAKSESANKLFTWNEKLRALHLAAGTWPANSHMQLHVPSFVLLIKDLLKVLKGRYTLMNAVLRFVIQTAES